MNGIKWLVGLIVLLAVQILAAIKADVHVPHGSSEGMIQAGKVGTAELADDAVTKAKLAGGFLKTAVIAGGAAGNHTVTGIATGDELVGVIRLDRDATAANINISALTAEFTISAANTINNADGTNTTGDALLVLYLDLT